MLRRPENLDSSDFPVPHSTPSANWSDIEPLCILCRTGRLYEIEQWIAEGRPIQCIPPVERKFQLRLTPLQTAVTKGFHSMAALLMANGYDPNGDYYECLTTAVRSRDRGLIDLLFRFGADPASCDFVEVLETYDRPIIDRFIEAGVDPCEGNAVARALRHKTRPLLGFVKSHWNRFPSLQQQIDIALHVFVEKRDEKGVSLMLWLGANPYVISPSSAYPEEADEATQCALETSFGSGRKEVRQKLLRKPIPREQATMLLRSASYHCCPDVIRLLLIAGADPNTTEEETGRPVLEAFVTAIAWDFASDNDRASRGMEALELMLSAGAKMSLSDRDLARLRRSLLKGRATTIARVIQLLTQYEGMPADQLRELTRTPTMRRFIQGRPLPGSASLTPPCVPLRAGSHSGLHSVRGYWRRHWAHR